MKKSLVLFASGDRRRYLDLVSRLHARALIVGDDGSAGSPCILVSPDGESFSAHKWVLDPSLPGLSDLLGGDRHLTQGVRLTLIRRDPDSNRVEMDSACSVQMESLRCRLDRIVSVADEVLAGIAGESAALSGLGMERLALRMSLDAQEGDGRISPCDSLPTGLSL